MLQDSIADLRRLVATLLRTGAATTDGDTIRVRRDLLELSCMDQGWLVPSDHRARLWQNAGLTQEFTLRTFAIAAATLGLVSVNVWLALLWREAGDSNTIAMANVTEIGAVIRSLDRLHERPKWEFLVASPDDEKLDSELRTLGAEGWAVSSCRRATREEFGKHKGIYECIMQRQVRP